MKKLIFTQYNLSSIQKIKSWILVLGILFISFNQVSAQTGKCLQFDGTNDYVSLPSVVTGDYTKELWINPSVINGFPNILSGTGTALFINNGNLAAGHATGGFSQLLDPTTPMSVGTWYHIAVTYNSTTGDMKLYKNGILVQTASSVPGYTETILELGRFASSNFFSGNMDEVRIWRTERTVSEIIGSKDCELTGDEPGLLAYYNFNQGVAGGTNTGITSLLDRLDNCTFISNGTLVDFALSGTTSNWVAPGPVLSGTCTNTFANINVRGSSICIANLDAIPSFADNTYFGSFGVIPITKSFTIENTGSAMLNISNINISGTNAADFTVSMAPAASVAPGNSTTFEITFSPTGATGLKTASVTINNSDLDEGLYNFIIGGFLAGQGKALNFDGVNDRVDLPVVFSGSYTKEAWIQTNSLSGFPNILSGNATTGTALFLNNGQLAAGHGPTFTQLLDPVPLVANTWYHVAVTYNAGTGDLKLYKDAVLVSSATGVPSYTETVQQIGAFGSNYFFSGNIDEVRFWNVERSSAQLLASKNCELNGIEPGLIAYYNFNQGLSAVNNAGASILNDLHGNCPLNGTLVNFALNGTTSNWVSPAGALSTSCTTQVSNISVTGNSICIETGDFTPVATDFTDFGMVNIGNTQDQTFVIYNNGGAVLNITAINIVGVNASSFSILTAPAVTIFPGASTTFVVRFNPSTIGIKNATVVIGNNDPNENNYNFAIQGEALAALPVTLLSFNATTNGKIAKLFWETSTEINNVGFEIQRSINGGSEWVTVGYIKATNFISGSKYFFNDLAPIKGLNLYRLNQLDIDGRNSISKIESLNFSAEITSIVVYPNPAKDKIKLVFNDPKLLNTYADISTLSGSVLMRLKLTTYQQIADIHNLSAGFYLIRFKNGEVQRIVKQ